MCGLCAHVKILMCNIAKSTEICSCDTKQFEVLMGMIVHCIQCDAACKTCTSGLAYIYMHALHAALSQYAHFCLSKGRKPHYVLLAQGACMHVCFNADSEAAFLAAIL